MADQKDQHPDSPAEDPTFLPLKKRAMAEKSLPGCKRAPGSDSDSSESGDDDDVDVADRFGRDFKKKKVQELKMRAFYSVLQAFRAETSTISNERTLIVEKLMNALNISGGTHTAFEHNIQKNLLAQQQRVDSSARDDKEMQKAEARPLTIPEREATSIPTPVRTSGSNWGSFNPETLVGKWVRIRVPYVDQFEDFVIKEYDAKEDMHRLEMADSNAMEMDDILSWMDVRQIPPRDIVWEGGQRPW